MEAVAQEIAERLRPAPFVRIVTHIDTDGITGGAIASEALDRSGIAHEVAFVKKLDEAIITDLKRQGTPLVWFIDLGAGMLHALHGLDAVITDHHVPTEREVPKALRGDLIRFTESLEWARSATSKIRSSGDSPDTIARFWRTESPPACWRRTSISGSTDERRGPRTRCSSTRPIPGSRG